MKEKMINRTKNVLAETYNTSLFTIHQIRCLSNVGIPMVEILGEKEVAKAIEKAIYKWINETYKNE